MCHANLYGIWTKSLQIIISDVPFDLWGWQTVGGNLLPVRSTILQASAACAELTSCNCKKQCSGKCKCSKANVRRTSVCLYDGHCYGNPKEHLWASLLIVKLHLFYISVLSYYVLLFLSR